MKATFLSIRNGNHSKKSTIIVSSLVFIASAVLAILVISRFSDEEQKRDERRLNDKSVIIEKHIIELFHDAFDAAELINFMHEHGDIENFELIAKEVIHETNNFTKISIIEEDTIRFVHPILNNAHYIGNKLLVNPNRDKWIQNAINDSTIYFEGPVHSSNGRLTINGRLPSFRNKKYSGYTAVSIDWDFFIKTVGIVNQKKSIFSYLVTTVSPDGKTDEFLAKADGFNDQLVKSIAFPNSNMKVWIKYKHPAQYFYSYFPFYLLFFLLSAFLAYTVYFKFSENDRIKELVDFRTKELKKSKDEYKQLFDQAADMIVLSDRAGNMKNVNKRMIDFIGYSEEELLSMSTDDFHVPEDLIDNPFNWDLVNKENSILSTRTLRTKDGEIKKVEVNIILTESNEVLGVARDITENEQLLQRNTEIKKMFQAGFESTSIGMTYTKTDGTWTHVNKALSKITGYSTEELIKLGFQNITHPNDLKPGLDFIEKANRNEAEEYSAVKRYIHKNGHIIWVEIHVTAVRNEKNEVLFYITLIEDISERRRLENELVLEQKFSNLIINSIPGILYVTNEKGEIVRVSEQVLKLSQKSYEDIIGKQMIDIIDESEHSKIIEQRKRAYKYGKSENDYHIKLPNGQVKDFYIVNTLIDLESGVGTIGIGIDITKMKEYEQQLIEFQSEIAERNKELKCLFEASELSRNAKISIKEFFNSIVKIIPPSFMFPAETSAKISYKGMEFLSPNFKLAKYSLKESILELGEVVGKIEVYCSTQLVIKTDSPFLNEERNLLLALSKIICAATEKRIFLKNLQKSEEKYRYLFENQPGVIMVWDLETLKLLEVNKASTELYGYTYEEMIGMSIKTLRPNLDYDKIEEFANQIIYEPNYDVRNTWNHLNKKGEVMMMDITSLRINFNDRKAVLAVGFNITELIQSEEKQKELTADIRLLKSNIESVRDDERLNLSRELHDDLGQKLTIMSLYLSILNSGIQNDIESHLELDEQIIQINQVISESISTVRNLSDSLRSGILGKTGLIDAIENQCSKLIDMYHLNCEITIQEGFQQLKMMESVSKEIFRIFQESVTNIIRHAHASKIAINLSSEGELFIMEIQDNGKGFNRDSMRKNSLGLLGIQERALIINANVQIDSELNKGTTVTLSIPMNVLVDV